MDKKLLTGYAFAAIALFLFSYTQVDLSLTLSRLSVLQTIQKGFQHIGYYDRPLATGIFIGLVGVFFFLYSYTLRIIERGKLTTGAFWTIVVGMTVILIFSYPAFSYDLFNYMFDAKTILVYHKNPYLVSPLQFTGIEPWLSFMHWTHVPSAYMPFWIALSIPAYLLGFGYFLTIMWSFKALMAAAYFATIWAIGKILHTLEPKHALLGMAIFALNPLVIFESLVSSHNDIVMMAFAVASFYLYVQKRRLGSFVLLSFSAATKVITGALLPLFVIGWQRTWSVVAIAAGFAFFILVTKREILPWYLIWFIPWYALLPRARWLRILGTGASFGFLLSYAPFLFTGNYNAPVPALKLWCVVVSILLSCAWIGYRLICPPNRARV